MKKNEQNRDLNAMIKTSGFAGTGRLADILLRYSTSVVLTRILGTNIFGLFVLIRAVTWIVATTGQMGMGLGLVKEISYYTAKNDKKKYEQIIRIAILACFSVSIIIALLMYIKADYISINLFAKPEMIIPLKALIFTIPIITLSYTLLDALRGFKRIKAKVLVEFYFLPLANLLLVIIFYAFELRLEGVIGAFILSNLFTLIILFILNRKEIKLAASPFLEKKVVFDFFKFSFPLMFVKILGDLRSRLDILLLGFLSTSSNVGVFFIAQRLANLMSVPWQATNTIFAPMVSGYFAREEIEKIEYNYKNITKLTFIFSMFFWGFLFVFSKELLSIFGSEFKKGAIVVILICFGQVVKTLVGHAGPVLTMVGKPSLNLLITIICLIIMALLNLLLIPKYGIIGAGLANVFGIIAASLLELFFVYRYLHIHPFRIDFFKPVISAFISGGIIFLIKIFMKDTLISVIFLMTAFVVLFFAFLYLLRLTAEEMFFLEKIKQKLRLIALFFKKSTV